MSSFKKLSKSDVTVVPYHANKQWGLNYCPYPTSSDYLTIYTGTNVTGAFSIDNDPITEGEYERLIYTQINQLFYQSYSASLNTSSLMFSLDNYASASQQRPTSSYFIYNDSDNLIQKFPTGAMEGIRVLSINQDIYGNKVLPNNFVLSSSAYYVVDDGYGNLYDLKAALGPYVIASYVQPNYILDYDPAWAIHIGNIYYAQGLAIITNQDYQYMFPQPPIAKNDTGSFLTTDVPKVISASLNDYARSGTLNGSTIAFSGSFSGPGYSFTTASNGTIVLTTAIPGTYTVYYTIGADIAGSCPANLRSNKAKVVVNVTEPTTTTTTTTSTTTTTTTPTTTSTTTTTTTVPTTTTTSTTTTTTTEPTTTTTTTSTTTTTTTAPTTTTTTTTSTTTSTTTAVPKTLSWTYTINSASGTSGQMKIYLNSIAIETRIANSSGTWPVYEGDTIYFEVTTYGCSGGNFKANSYTLAGSPSHYILADATCANNSTVLTTGTYTVQSSDNTITVNAYSTCDSGCV